MPLLAEEKTAIAAATAAALLDIGAVHVNVEKPFMLTSGWASPVYIDCRKLISFLEPRRKIIAHAARLLTAQVDMAQVDYIAGGETAGISYAAWMSEALSKPMLYVRKKPKGFGRGAQIEGEMNAGARVLLVEDLTTDGGSKITFANVLRDAGAHVTDAFSVFYYGIYKDSAALFQDAGLTLHHLATWADVLAEARARHLLSVEQLAEVERFLAEPAQWSRAHGGAFERVKTA